MQQQNNRPRTDHVACLHCEINRSCRFSFLQTHELGIWCPFVRTWEDREREKETTPDEDGLLQSWQIAKTANRELNMN